MDERAPAADALRAREYFETLIGLAVDRAEALAMTVAWIQAEAMRQIPLELEERPKPRRA